MTTFGPFKLRHLLNEVYKEHPQVMQNVPLPWSSPDDLDRIVQKASYLFIFASTVVKFVANRLHDPIPRLQAMLEDKPSNGSPYTDLDALYLDAIAVIPDADAIHLILGVVYCLSVIMSVPASYKLLDRQDVDARIIIPALGLTTSQTDTVCLGRGDVFSLSEGQRPNLEN